MIDKIRTDIQYKQVMALIETFLQRATEQGGFHTLKKKDSDELHRLSILAQAYEDEVRHIMPLPVTISAIVRQKIEELNITQNQLADMLNIASSKLSQILNGKREPDVSFLKAVHEKLGIDGNLILERV
jgi:antitoxin component HigA of HigAB toxin-antitoxin module